ncbi:hypothetical protein [Salinigranum salinum]|uniref:hypothetical protein n=1 Tax=Salinigranum salinum TaxID=1364937 RepID=UPI0012607467|nr:hypothetical protein [Salinigranum salinum]
MTTTNTMATLLTAVVLVGAIVAPVAATTAQAASQTTTTADKTAPLTGAAGTADANATSTPAPTTTETVTESSTETTSAQTDTATETSTPEPASETTATTCDVSADETLLSQNRLYAPETTIETDSPGQIAGGFQAAPHVDCPIVVRITMSVPSGMEVTGSSDVLSGGAGMVSGSFVVDDATGIEDIRATVYGTSTGDHTVTADIEYWPQGHEELAQSLDGLRFTFQVESPSEDMPTESDSPSEEGETTSALGDVPFSWAVTGGLMALLFVAISLRRP